ncbi:MAG: aminotransferase class I/II-fold pyridoxal phosphate-dependent enzyme [Methanobacteriota archaeon]|nr:MAG: aminotransferase class I/II-fold pyridoxal phosphate-dependent enzyme [Euryarchaeota archaeon]
MQISNRVGSMKYAIRDVQQVANQMQKEGHEILFFNIGDPNKFDFNVPQTMQNALRDNLNRGYYSQSEGDEFVRTKIAEYENAKYSNGVHPDDVIFTQGVSEGILYLFLAFLNPGDKVLVPAPTYPAYQSIATVSQAKLEAYRCSEELGWAPDLDDIRSKIDNTTKLVVVINPNNPTGAVYPEATLRKLKDIVGEYDAAIVADEIYDRMLLDGDPFTSMSTISKDVPVVVFNGFSKNYLAPGWRAAYMYAIDPEGRIEEPYEGVRKLCRTRLSPNTPISYASVMGLDLNPPHLPELIRKVRERRDLVVRRFNEMETITTQIPKAAFYIFPKLHLDMLNFSSDQDVIINLLKEEKVLMVHGSGFGVPDHFRMVYLSTPDILEEGLTRMDRFLKRHMV